LRRETTRRLNFFKKLQRLGELSVSALVILRNCFESKVCRLNLQFKQQRNRFIIILGVGHASGIKSSKLETIVHLLVLLGHILGEEFLGVVKEDCIVGSEDKGLSYSLQIRKLRKGLIISLERFIENPKVLNLSLLEQLLKSFQMLLQLIVIQGYSRIVRVNRLGRLETCRFFRNIIEISDKVQERLNFFTGSAVQICIETNERFPSLFNIRYKLN